MLTDHLTHRQEQICTQWSATIVEQYGSILDIYTVVTLVATETVVAVDRNKHVYKTLQQFASAIGNI